jgi:hypothetical protein
VAKEAIAKPAYQIAGELIRLHGDNFLMVRRKSIGDVLQRHEWTQTHQEATKQQG